MIRRHLGVALAALIATGGVANLSGAHAAATSVVPEVGATTSAPLCVWLDVLDLAYCVQRAAAQ